LLYHPDKNPATEELFKEINNAYQILSHPELRARYDLKLQYQRENETAPPPAPTYYRPNPYQYKRRYRPRPQHEYERWLSKENIKSTLYAFMIALGIGTTVMAAIWINGYYQEQEYQEFLKTRRAAFMVAKANFESGNYQKALDDLANLGGLRKEETDIDQYKKDAVNQLYDIGMAAYANKNYPKAIRYFDLIKPYYVAQTVDFKKILADCYLGINDYQKGLSILNLLMVDGVQDVQTILKIANVHENILNDYSRALEYYEWGNRVSLEEYEGRYGKAFALMLNTKNIPSDYYELYFGLARMYQSTGQHQKALDAAKWSTAIWPDSTHNFIIRGNSALALNNTRLACTEFRKAKKINPKLPIPDICR
jgi:curved DNA-binding protein CbpA